MNMFIKDEIGVPSTLGAIWLNTLQIMGVDIINVGLTWVISTLSIVYLIYKIRNEKNKYERHKDNGTDSNDAS
jgi:hypothetical protein